MKHAEMCRAVQLRELEILKEVVKLCDRHGLRYFASGGTCLGAARHRGFIPWDDDVDIGMPREDFDRFRAVAPAELPPHLALLDFRTCRESTVFHLKVHDTRTSFIETATVPYPSLHTGIWVDIFPQDGWPAPGLKRAVLKKKLAFLWKANVVLRLPDAAAEERVGRSWFKRLAFLRRSHAFSWASDRIEELLRRCPLESSAYFCPEFNEAYPSAGTRIGTALPFEDITLPAFEDCETYLWAHYGPWRRLPPEGDRNSGHAAFYISLDKPCREWDGVGNIDGEEPVPYSPDERLDAALSRMDQYDFLRKGGWRDLAGEALRKSYIDLWQIMARDNLPERREEIASCARRVIRGQARGGQIIRAARFYLFYRRFVRKTKA